MLRYFFLIFVLGCFLVVALAGWRGQTSTKPPIQIFPDMVRQPKVNPQVPSDFFADGRAARASVPGTVPMGYVVPNAYYTTGGNNHKFASTPGGFSKGVDYFNTGKLGDSYGEGFPIEVTPELMARGKERFDINCTPCHGALGLGNGIVGQYGLVAIANLQQDRIRTMPEGQIFNTITNGKNTMGAYGSNITVEDRWAIIAYIRALQRSQFARLDDVPEVHRADLDKPQEAPKK